MYPSTFVSECIREAYSLQNKTIIKYAKVAISRTLLGRNSIVTTIFTTDLNDERGNTHAYLM